MEKSGSPVTLSRKVGSIPDRPHKKEWRTSMEIECLTPEFPQGARVYSSDGIAPTLLNSASAMRSQSILIRGGQHECSQRKINVSGREFCG